MLRVHCEVSRDTVETPPTSAPFGVVRLGLGGPYRHLHRVSVIKALGKHPAPFRTRKLSLSAPMVLHGGPCGRLGRRRTTHHLRVNHTCWLTLRCFHVHTPTPAFDPARLACTGSPQRPAAADPAQPAHVSSPAPG